MDRYLQKAFEEQFKESGLTVMARGLGVRYLLIKFIKFYCSDGRFAPSPPAEVPPLPEQGKQKKLVFVINAGGIEELIKNGLMHVGLLPNQFPSFITNEVSVQDRVDMYMRGGCFVITSRILIVDLLDDRIDPSHICGFLIPNAHRITELSIESFILRVYRDKNRDGFIKAFTEEPEALQGEMHKVEKLLALLWVKRLYLWPRFEDLVSNTLKQSEPEVIELSQGITKDMEGVQKALVVAMNQVIIEIKKAIPHVDTSNVTLENGLFQSFDRTIRRQLEHEWFKLSIRTKQLVTDLTVIRKLLDYLIRYDCFSFYSFLISVKNASNLQTQPSLWLSSEAAEHLFKRARERVFAIVSRAKNAQKAKVATKAPSGAEIMFEDLLNILRIENEIKPVLECPPKWKLLRDIIGEIKEDYDAKSANASSSSDRNGRILIIVNDIRTSHQLRECLSHGIDIVIDQHYRWLVSQQAAELRSRAKSLMESHLKNVSKNGSSSISVQSNDTNLEYGNKICEELGLGLTIYELNRLTGDQKLLILHELKLRKFTPAVKIGSGMFLPIDTLVDDSEMINDDIDTNTNETNVESKTSEVSVPFDKDSSVKEQSNKKKKSDHKNAAVNRVMEITGKKDAGKSVDVDEIAQQTDKDYMDGLHNKEGEGDTLGDFEVTSSYLDPALNVTVMTQMRALELFDILSDVKPAYVILYDPDVTLVRNIEIYQSKNEGERVKVYFLLYSGSVEEHRYVGSLTKEKAAFVKLIETKEHMVIPLPDTKSDVDKAKQSDFKISMDTRTLKRSLNEKGPKRIIVDVREFRSSLPSLLHFNDIKIIPRTLYIGDYVLSTEICVERKGLSDLYQSFQSGRLYNQAHAMMTSYSLPCLLIEFHPDRAFRLQGDGPPPADIQTHHITSRMVTLMQAFPKMKLLWSRSPHMTADIFKSIAENHDGVDVNKATSIGSNINFDRDDSKDCGDVIEKNTKQTAMDILMSLPGINIHNFRDVVDKVSCVAELAKLSELQLTPIIGPVNAKKLRAFFNGRKGDM